MRTVFSSALRSMLFLVGLLVIFIPNASLAEEQICCTFQCADGYTTCINIDQTQRRFCTNQAQINLSLGAVNCAGSEPATGYGIVVPTPCADQASACNSTQDAPEPVQEQAGTTAPAFGVNPLCPAGSTCTIPDILGRVIRTLLGIVGSIALAMFIYGGFIWMTGAERGEKKVRYAKEVILWAILGLVVIFAAYIITDFVIKRLQP